MWFNDCDRWRGSRTNSRHLRSEARWLSLHCHLFRIGGWWHGLSTIHLLYALVTFHREESRSFSDARSLSCFSRISDQTLWDIQRHAKPLLPPGATLPAVLVEFWRVLHSEWAFGTFWNIDSIKQCHCWSTLLRRICVLFNLRRTMRIVRYHSSRKGCKHQKHKQMATDFVNEFLRARSWHLVANYMRPTTRRASLERTSEIWRTMMSQWTRPWEFCEKGIFFGQICWRAVGQPTFNILGQTSSS